MIKKIRDIIRNLSSRFFLNGDVQYTKTYQNWDFLSQQHKDRLINLARKKGHDINDVGIEVPYLFDRRVQGRAKK